MASTAEVKLEAGDKATPAAAKKAGGLFHRPHMPHLPSKAKKAGQSTADMHSALDKSRFKNDPRMPQIKQEIAEMDADGDGHLDQEEVATYILEHLDTEAAHAKSQQHAKKLTKMLWAAAVIMTIFLALNACLTAAVVEMSRVTKIEDTGTTLTKTGTLVTVGQQQTVLPLSSMLYLPRVFRSQLEHLTVKLKSAGGTEVDMKVQSTEFSPAKKAYKGVSRPSTRVVGVDFGLSGTMYLSGPTGPDKMAESHVITAFTAALTKVLPADSTPDGAPPISVTATVEDTDIGDNPNALTSVTPVPSGRRQLGEKVDHQLVAVSGQRRQLGHAPISRSSDTFVEVTGKLGQAHNVIVASKIGFSTLDRDLASSAGLRLC